MAKRIQINNNIFVRVADRKLTAKCRLIARFCEDSMPTSLVSKRILTYHYQGYILVHKRSWRMIFPTSEKIIESITSKPYSEKQIDESNMENLAKISSLLDNDQPDQREL